MRVWETSLKKLKTLKNKQTSSDCFSGNNNFLMFKRENWPSQIVT